MLVNQRPMKIQINNFCCFVVPSMFLLVDNMFILKRITFFTTLLTRKHFQLEHAKHWRPFNWALHTHWLNLRIIMMYLFIVPKPNKKERKMETITQVQAQKLSVLLSFKNNAEQRPKGNFVWNVCTLSKFNL